MNLGYHNSSSLPFFLFISEGVAGVADDASKGDAAYADGVAYVISVGAAEQSKASARVTRQVNFYLTMLQQRQMKAACDVVCI